MMTVTARASLADSRLWMVGAISVGWMLVLGTRLVIPALLPQISAEFDISNTTAGVAISMIWMTYAVAQFPAGVLSDRRGERQILTVSIAIASVSIVLFAVVPTLMAFFAACVVFGLGTGLYGPPRVTIISKSFPKRAGTMMGFTFAAGNIGAAILPFVGGVLALRFGWRAGLAFVLPAFLFVSYVLWRTVPTGSAVLSETIPMSPHQVVSQLISAFRNRTVLLLSGASALMGFTYQGFTAFLPLYLVTIKGVSQPTAALLFGAFFATGAIVQPLAGYLSDRLGELRLLLALTVVHVLALVAMPFVGSVPVLVALIIVLGTRLGLGPVSNAFLVATLPSDVQGSGYGFLRSFFLSISATGSIVIGAFADADRFDEAFFFLAAVILVAMMCYSLLPPNSDGR